MTWRRYLAWGAAYAVASAAVLAAIPLLFGSPLPKIHIQWRDVGDADRVVLEQQFALTEATPLSDGVWSYVPTDTSIERLRTIVTHPAVADTNGINRRVFQISDSPPLTPRRGGLVDAPPWMARGARLLGYLLACIAGVFFLRAGLASPALQFVGRAFTARLGSVGRALSRSPREPDQPSRFALRRSAVASAEAEGFAPHEWTFVAAAVAMFAATLAWRFLTFTGFTNDHYVHVALAQQTLLGERPIRDFIDSGWPLMYLLSAAAWRVAGDTLLVEWAIAAGAFALGAACTVVAGYRLSRSIGIALIVTIFEVLIYPRTYSYPKVAAYAAAAWAILALAARPSTRRLVLMAAIIAIAFLLRHDHGLFIGTASAVCLLVASRTEGWRVGVRRAAVLTAVVILFLLPWILFVAMNGGLVAYFQGGLEYSRDEASATSLTSLPTLDPASSLFSTANAEAWLFWLFWSLPVLCGAIVCVRALRGRERWAGEFAAVTSLIVLAILVNASFLRQALQVRVPDAIVPAALLAAWALGLCWMGRWRRRSLQVATQFATVVVLAVSVGAITRIGDLQGQYENADLARGIAGLRERTREVWELLGSRHIENASPPSRFTIPLMPFFAYLDRCTSTSDRLIVTGEFPEVLVLAGRGFAGDGLVFGSWYASATHQDRTLERLRARPALFVLHIGDYAGFRSRFGLIDDYVNTAYEPMAEVPVEDADSIRILVHAGRMPVRTDPQTGWPCFR